jgi:drug/metabolite transporter (DMT)-like permease
VAELTLASGLVAVVFSSIIFLNIFNGAIFLKAKIRLYVIYGAVIGVVGVALVFKEEITSFSLTSGSTLAFFLAVLAAISASLGNITSAFLQRNKLPVIQTNAFGMLYGALHMLVLCLVLGKPFTFEVSFAYISSLVYLSIFGSIIAFTSFLTLLGRIGADKAAYITLIIPIIALLLSTIFENYQWNWFALAGVLLIIAGNIIVLKKQS